MTANVRVHAGLAHSERSVVANLRRRLVWMVSSDGYDTSNVRCSYRLWKHFYADRVLKRSTKIDEKKGGVAPPAI